jgi:mono/diheme cytochrome c family protein
MKVLNTKILIVSLLVGLLSACGIQPTEAPASPPTEEAVPATEAPVATDTSAPAAQPTEEPATTTEEPASTTDVSFTNDVLPILQSRCLNCHGGDRLEEGLSMKTYADLIAGSENGLVITPGDAENSLLVELVSTQKMPKRGPKLTPPQVQLIIDWINQGALDN